MTGATAGRVLARPCLWSNRHAFGTIRPPIRAGFADRLSTWGGGRRPESRAGAEDDMADAALVDRVMAGGADRIVAAPRGVGMPMWLVVPGAVRTR